MIRFSAPLPQGNELAYVQQAVASNTLAGVGPFARRCEDWLQHQLGAPRVLMTASCTAALELSALLLDIGPGDEVIVPSFTFCTTASAFALRGARIVFADIDPDSLCMTAREAEPLINERTKAVVAVHYAGYGAYAADLAALCRTRNVTLVEDAAQAVLSYCDAKPLGTFGALAALSFHDTKNVTAGEGGALIVNDPALVQRAEVLRDKGTDRARFFRGEVDKYTWQELGSSYVPAELCCAYLFGQLEVAEVITARRRAIAARYFDALADVAPRVGARICARDVLENSNGHMFWLIARDPDQRARIIEHLRAADIAAVHHYVPLHSSPAGLRYGHTRGSLEVTNHVADRLLRLPLHLGLDDSALERVCLAANRAMESAG